MSLENGVICFKQRGEVYGIPQRPDWGWEKREGTRMSRLAFWKQIVMGDGH